MRAIETCRTPARGGHLDVCDACGYARPAYNSCRNRHCPKCEALREARWIEARMARLLPSPYFHVVFTLPAELRPLALRNRRRLRRARRPTGLRAPEAAALPPRLGRLREAAVCRRRPGLPLPRPLYPSRRALEPPPARRRRDGRALRHQARARGVPAAGRIHPPLPPPRPPRPLRQDPPLRPLRARPRGGDSSRARPPPPRRPARVDPAGGLAHALPP